MSSREAVAVEHCGDRRFPHGPHQHRTPAYVGEWRDCPGTPMMEEGDDA